MKKQEKIFRVLLAFTGIVLLMIPSSLSHAKTPDAFAQNRSQPLLIDQSSLPGEDKEPDSTIGPTISLLVDETNAMQGIKIPVDPELDLSSRTKAFLKDIPAWAQQVQQ